MKNSNENTQEVHEAINCVSEIRNILTGNDYNDDLDITHNRETENLIEKLKDSERVEFITETLKSKKPKADSEKLKKHLKSLASQRRRSLIIRLGVATTVVAASLVALFVILFNGEDNAVISHTNKISGITEPTLINENGVLINLNTINETVETESYSITKYADSKLEYVARNDCSDKTLHLTVPAGYSYTIILNDGTEITLNGGSELSYPVKFSEKMRQVEFKGEAYFKVAKSDIPFIVNTENLYVKVYGTEFNINTQQKDKFEAVLIRGSVGVGLIGETDTKINPNQMYEYNFNSKTQMVYDVEADDYISWLDNSFCYQNRSVDAIIADISAWYGVSFTTKRDFSDLNLTFNISRSTDIDELLSFIESLTNVKFIKETKGGYNIE